MELVAPPAPVVELLLRCARTGAADCAGNVERVRALIGETVDAAEFFELAQFQRVTPLVWASLAEIGQSGLPPAVAARFATEVRSNALHNVYWTRRLLQLIALLGANGIPALPYKGPVLAVQAYGQPSLREFADLDLLVHPEHVGAARALLLAEGFQQSWPRGPLSPRREADHLRTKYNIALRHSVDRLDLELHWGITPNYLRIPSDNGELWQGLGEVTLAGQTLPAFTPARLLLILCVHGANHCWVRLNWLCDVAELLRRNPALDWAAVTRDARRWGCLRILHLGLMLAADLLDAELPADLRRQLAADSGARRLAAQAARRLTRFPSVWLRPFEEPVFHLRMRERQADRLRYCLGMTTPTVKDWSYWPLPERLAPLYYLLRPVRLVIDHGFRLLQ